MLVLEYISEFDMEECHDSPNPLLLSDSLPDVDGAVDSSASGALMEELRLDLSMERNETSLIVMGVLAMASVVMINYMGGRD